MIKWLTISLVLLASTVNAQYIDRIYRCLSNVETVKYSVEYNSNYQYQFDVVNGEIISQNNGDVLITWNLNFDYCNLYVTVVNEFDCFATSILTVEVYPCNESTIYVPSAFTPNDDNNNQKFTPRGTNLNYYEMAIFDRWGTELYFTRNIDGGWDGNYKGKKCPGDIYVYHILYQDHNNYYHILDGKIVLLR